MFAPVKKVLIALDYNPTAKKVADAGYALARSMNSEPVLLHVIADEYYYSSPEYSPVTGFTNFTNADFSELVNTEGLKSAARFFLDRIKQYLDDDTIATIVEKGDFADVILKTAENIRADIIVVGSHSRRWLDQILMGSVTEEVLHHTSIPLFIIPTKGSKPKK